MKVVIVYDRKNFKSFQKSNYIKSKLKSKGKIHIEMSDISSNTKKLSNIFDIYILIIDNIKDILFCKNQISDYNKILILTENTNTSFILTSIDITKNLLYLNVDFDIIYQKICVIDSENKKL